MSEYQPISVTLMAIKIVNYGKGKLTNFQILFLKVFKESINQFEFTMFKMIPDQPRGDSRPKSTYDQQIKPETRLMSSVIHNYHAKGFNTQSVEHTNQSRISNSRVPQQSHPSLNSRLPSIENGRNSPIAGFKTGSLNSINSNQYNVSKFQSQINRYHPESFTQPLQKSNHNLQQQGTNFQNSNFKNSIHQNNTSVQSFPSNRGGFLNSSIHQSSSNGAQLYFCSNPNVNNTQRLKNLDIPREGRQVQNINAANQLERKQKQDQNREGRQNYTSQQISNQSNIQSFQKNIMNKQIENGRKGTQFAQVGEVYSVNNKFVNQIDFNRNNVQVHSLGHQEEVTNSNNLKKQKVEIVSPQCQDLQLVNSNNRFSAPINHNHNNNFHGFTPFFDMIGLTKKINEPNQMSNFEIFRQSISLKPEKQDYQNQWQITKRRVKKRIVVKYKTKSEQQKNRESQMYLQMMRNQKEQWYQAEYGISYSEYLQLQRNEFKVRVNCGTRIGISIYDKKQSFFTQQQVQVSQFETRQVQYIIDLRWVEESQKIRKVFTKSKVYVGKRPKRGQIKQAILQDLRRNGFCFNRKYQFEERSFDFQRQKPNFLMKWIFGKKQKCLKDYTFEGSILQYKIDTPDGYEYFPKSFKGLIVANLVIRNEFGYVQWPDKIDLEGISFANGFRIEKDGVICQIDKLKKKAIASLYSDPGQKYIFCKGGQTQTKKLQQGVMKSKLIEFGVENEF